MGGALRSVPMTPRMERGRYPPAGRKRARAREAASRAAQPSRWSFTRPIACMKA